MLVFTKKIFIYIFYSIILGTVFACTSNVDKKETASIDNSNINLPLAGEPVIITQAGNIQLVVTTQKAVLRAEPNLNSPVISIAAQKDTFYFANRISEHTLKMRLEGIDYEEPWVKIYLTQDSTETEKTAWVYGGNISFINLHNAQLQELILSRRIRSVFGEDYVRQYHMFRARCAHISTDIAFELAWRTSEEFIENLSLRLADIVQQQQQITDTIANFYWLNELFEGSAYLHWYAPHNKYYIWKDLRFWQAKSLLTAEETDDAFIQTQFKLYSPDSITFYQPQTSLYVDGKNFCTLGNGVYEEILMYIGAQLQNDTLFKPYYRPIVQTLLSEMVHNNYYWRPIQEIIQELKNIINYAPVELFTPAELLILDNRLRELESPENHAIFTNILEIGI